MRWDLLGTTQGYEVPMTEFFLATVWLCLQRQAALRLQQGAFLPSVDIQKGRLSGLGSNPVSIPLSDPQLGDLIRAAWCVLAGLKLLPLQRLFLCEP